MYYTNSNPTQSQLLRAFAKNDVKFYLLPSRGKDDRLQQLWVAIPPPENTETSPETDSQDAPDSEFPIKDA